MKKIVINDNNLIDQDMERKVIRVKGLIINDKNQILLAHNNNTYQFPGGHIEDYESRNECIKREIKEETGIDIYPIEDPFLCIKTYDNNYFGSGKKVINSIYYYRFLTNELPNLEETHYDELELATDFKLFYVDFKDLEGFLLKSIDDGSIDSVIAREMIKVVKVYNEYYGG